MVALVVHDGWEVHHMDVKNAFLNSLIKEEVYVQHVTPHSEIAEMKPPYVCPGCLIHMYSNNMINRCHIQ
jgi:hypothetical protein